MGTGYSTHFGSFKIETGFTYAVDLLMPLNSSIVANVLDNVIRLDKSLRCHFRIPFAYSVLKP